LDFEPLHPGLRAGTTEEPKFEQRRIRPEGSVSMKKVACVLRQVELKGVPGKKKLRFRNEGQKQESRKAGKFYKQLQHIVRHAKSSFVRKTLRP